MTKNTILGGLSVTRFLREYWQKKPLLIRSAFPGFSGLLDKKQLFTLSCQEDAQSRLICYHRDQWLLKQGPFRNSEFNRLTGNWTLLVQDVNYFFSEAQNLLKSFNFIPHARLDDLMISFATDGSGVGPHFDSYDVFLLQGSGQRLWQISQQTDHRLIEDAPCRILKYFKPEQEWLLEPGDMLYLPPNYAHNGIAVGESMTYSIGFRAPSHQELAQEFLLYLSDHIQLDGIYTDPDLQYQKQPGRIPTLMIDKVAAVLNNIQFDKNDIANFLVGYLSEPKSHLVFDSPQTPISKKKFIQTIKLTGVRLALKSQLLFTDKQFFMNGEANSFDATHKAFLQQLANERTAKPTVINEAISDLLYEWYQAGYLEV